MPGLTGIIDKWINAERLYGILHLIGAGALIYASTATTYNHMYWAMLLNMLVYMPIIPGQHRILQCAGKYKMDLIKTSPIRVWGTVGFICAMWAGPFRVQGKFGTALCGSHLGSHAGTLRFHPACLPPPCAVKEKRCSPLSDWTALVLFKAQEDGYLLPILHVAGSRPSNNKHLWRPFPGSFASIPEYADSFGVKHPHPALHLANE